MDLTTSTNYAAKAFSGDDYGTCIDSQQNVWITELYGGNIKKFDKDGNYLGEFPHGGNYAQGCVIGAPPDDDVYVAHALFSGVTTIGHLKNDGTTQPNISVGPPSVCEGPTGVARDRNGMIWAACYLSNTVVRIDPATNTVDKVVDLGAGASPYNYSDMTGTKRRDTANVVRVNVDANSLTSSPLST